MPSPKLRSKKLFKEPYQTNHFSDEFARIIAEEIYASLAIGREDLEGKDWERIFARAIGAKWRPSQIGLDDILMKEFSAAWGAKSVKNKKPFTAKSIRLISGRNSPDFSFDVSNPRKEKPDRLGELVLGIWNQRVASLYSKYNTLRTVVLLKGDELKEVAIFEVDTTKYDFKEYSWVWNRNKNLTGVADNGKIKFTWQPHGSQFTIHEEVPEKRLKIRVKQPKMIETDTLLKLSGFSEKSYEIVK